MSLIEHARRELNAIGYSLDGPGKDGPDKWVMENVLELLETFSKQGHSGSSAPYVAALFQKLANYEPLCPLKGTDDEWNEVGHGMWQNNRCSHVFKGEDGVAYDIEAIIFKDSNGSCYINRDSRRNITFPYTPERVYLSRPSEPDTPFAALERPEGK
jgi:hypothetical protein